MIYEQFIVEGKNTVVRDGTLRDLDHYIAIAKSRFPVHSIFSLTKKEIKEYLSTRQMIVAERQKKIIGGNVIVVKSSSASHGVFRYNHLAVSKPFEKMGAGSALMRASDNYVLAIMKLNGLRTAKIELYMSENEKKAPSFFNNSESH